MAINTEVDDTRRALNFRGIQDTIALRQSGVTVVDPYSTLVSPNVDIGERAIIWPGVTIQCAGDSGTVSIASETILHSGTRIVVSDGGTINIGASVEIGEEGGFTFKAGAGATITIGDGARLLGGGRRMISAPAHRFSVQSAHRIAFSMAATLIAILTRAGGERSSRATVWRET